MSKLEYPSHPDWIDAAEAAKHRRAFSSGILVPSISLPKGKTKIDVIKALKRARRALDIKPAVLAYLEHQICMTQAEDWEQGATPVAFSQVKTLAAHFDVEERTIRNYESSLARKGLILWNDSGNHRRYAKRDETGKLVDAYGIVLTPLIERFADIEKMGEADAADLQLRSSEIGRIRSLRRVLSYLAEHAHAHDLSADVTCAAEKLLQRIPCRSFSKKAWPTIAVCSLRLELEDQIARLKHALTSVLDQEISAQAEQGFRRQYTEDTRQNPVGTCSGERTSPDGGEVIGQTEPANAGGMEKGSRERAQGPDVPTRAQDSQDTDRSCGATGIEHIRFDQVTDVASELMRELIAGEAGQGRGNWSSLDRAAATAAAWIGVSPSLWANLRGEIGSAAAAVSIVLVERRMTDPDNPISSPGGYLRGMLAKAGRGQLHLHRSVFGLLKQAQPESGLT
ncbi:plasmid replication protein RepC [Roseibium marinum]|uniref:Replication protein C-like n=1 Tax=Roseibium marinum TaxID=281252 RepID=A0A2S3UJ80_9HYPH|nr:plasmid replication protein RepC [Roseibium marinum]POF27758.1 replication protein C-like [Roseibium marinum]